MRPAVLVTGARGLIGSKLLDDFSDKYSFETIDISDEKRPVDITNLDQVMQVFATSAAEAVVHFAAYTNVTEAWKQAGDTDGLAYQVNVVGTENIARAAEEHGKHVIHISTAYVFDGKKESLYTEDDPIAPIEWYGETKVAAEKLLQDSAAQWTILRIDQPFRDQISDKLDIAHRIAQNLIQESLPPQFTNHFFGPTYIPDFAKVIDWVLRTNTSGLFHASSGEQWSDYRFAQAIEEVLATKQNLAAKVTPGNLDAYLQSANRPYQRNTALNSTKLQKKLDFSFIPIQDALKNLEL